MNKSSATIMAAALMLASSCTEVKQEGQGYEPIIGKQEITIKRWPSHPRSPVGNGTYRQSEYFPRRQKIAYTVAYYSVPRTKAIM